MKYSMIVAAALGVASAGAFANAEEAMAKAGCMACHAKDKRGLGPSFKDIAAHYKGQDVTATLMEKVRKGGFGNFGRIPMPPNAPEKISDADLKAAVELILSN